MLGLGTVESPYIISTAQDLQNVQNDLLANYELANDIDLTGINFIPIGGTSLSQDQAFKGIFDGKGFKIINLKINQTTNYAALFSYVYGGTILNLGLENVDITGGQYSAALSSYCFSNSTVKQCYATGKVYCTQYYTGGLIGGNSGTLVEDCWTNVAVTCTTTNATYMKYTGGFAARDSGSSIFRRCFSLGTVKNGTTSAKGFLGNPNVTTSSSRTLFPSTYYDKTTSGCTTDGESGVGAVGYTTSQMQTSSTYFAYDGVDTWYISDGSYPTLQVFDKTIVQIVNVIVQSTVETILGQSSTVKTSRRQSSMGIEINASNYTVRNVKRFGNGFTYELYATATEESRSVRSIYVNVSSDISPIYALNKRKAKVKRVNVSSVDRIEGIINFIGNQKPKQVIGLSFYKDHYSHYDFWTNNSECSYEVSTSNASTNENDTVCNVIENRSSVEVS
jgi:hypothetical protein